VRVGLALLPAVPAPCDAAAASDSSVGGTAAGFFCRLVAGGGGGDPVRAGGGRRPPGADMDCVAASTRVLVQRRQDGRRGL
jgi:hypothetical protein